MRRWLHLLENWRRTGKPRDIRVKFNQLRDVIAVATCGSLHAAARHLKITQPALTRSIHELERELGTALFERHSRGVVPTAMGHRFLERARAVLAELEHARDEIRQMKGEDQGRVSVCLGVLPHVMLLSRALKAFRVRHPGVQLDIVEGRFPTVESSLRAGVVDLFVGPLHSDVGKEFVVETLYPQEGAILCRKGHPLGKSRSVKDLAKAEWLTNSITLDPSAELAPLFAQHGLPTPRLAVQSHSALTMLTVLSHSDLLVILPADLIRSTLGKTFLQRIPITEKVTIASIVMIRRAGLPLTPAAEYFADMMRRAGVEMRRLHAAARR